MSEYELAREEQSSSSLNKRFGSRTSVNSKRSAVVSCRICLSNILDPACLTCGHKFCEKCLEKYWDAKDRPDYIVCPLCRNAAFNVDFTKKAPPSTEEFRKTFNTLQDIAEGEESNNLTSFNFKISILVPAVYYLLKWLGLPIIGLLTSLRKC